MKRRIFKYLIVGLITAFATYSMVLVNIESSWFERAKWIQTTSRVLTFTIPVLFVFVFFQRHFSKLAYALILILLLSLAYGLYFAGFNQMVSQYKWLTIGYVVCTVLLIALIRFEQSKVQPLT